MKTYPISEIFTSPQGEGQYAGAMMTFIRTAGCNVGKHYPRERYEATKPEQFQNLLPVYTEMCTLYDGRTFECDTDYRKKQKMTVAEIAKEVPSDVMHACITGGEPFLHDLEELAIYLSNHDIQVHVETSGTLPVDKAFPSGTLSTEGLTLPIGDSQFAPIWITCSPKYPVLPEMILLANEIKLLVDPDFNPDKLPKEVFKHPLVYIQPVNFEHKINGDNLKLAMEWQQKYPQWRVSVQLHKALEAATEQRVR